MKSEVKTAEGTEEITAVNVQEYNPGNVKFEKMQRGRKYYLYSAQYAVLDTETSHKGEFDGWIYQWAFKFCGQYVYGRTPSEFIDLLCKLRDRYKLHSMKRIIIYIHNAAYDLQYLKMYLINYDSNIKMLATDTHSILICDVFGFRILCSYKLSNMNLDLFAKSYAKHFRKASGAVDYSIIHYQDDELTSTDWYYMFSDVASQHEAIEGYLNSLGYDRAYKAPFTSTGFVRNDCRHAAESQKGWRKEFINSAFTLDQYKLARQAFMGGITISSYKYNGEIVEGNLKHLDFTSSYPARQMKNYFPVGKPMWYGEIESRDELNTLLKNYCCIFLLTMHNVHIKHGVTAPYIPYSKCIHPVNELKVNGKIVYAEKLTIAITEVDFKWIEKQYTADKMQVTKMMIMQKGESPKWLKSKVMQYFNDKCTLKHGAEGETPEEAEARKKRYNASKALLNGLYGMSATAIIRPEYELDEEGMISLKDVTNEENVISNYYHSYNSFIPYQLGVWTTAHARDALMSMIEAVGYDHFLYCDTDSVFYLETEENKKRIEEMNKEIKTDSISKGAFVGDHILGYATEEAPLKRFKSLHAKCYACEELNEKSGQYELHVTIAGVPKKSIVWNGGHAETVTNAQELVTLENLEDGFTFHSCGGTRCIYVEQEIQNAEINGHITDYASAAIIENIDKTISDTMYTVGKDYSLLHIKQETTL